MSGCDKPIAGHRKFWRAKSCSSEGPPGSFPLDRIKICGKRKNGPPGVGAWPNISLRTDFWGNNRFTYEFFAGLFRDTFAVQCRRRRANHATKRQMARRLNPASQVKVSEYRNLALYSRGIVVATTLLKFSEDRIMPTGKVKFYREDSGYGLIEPDDGGKDVFVHVTSVADPSVEIFREDRRVRYVERVSQRSGNPEAFDVVVL